MAIHIRKDDNVKVISGPFAGKTGTVVRAIPSENKVVVSGVNLRKRHEKPSQANQAGGIVEKEMPIHASNVMVIDPKSGNPVRTRRDRSGKVSKRVSVKSGNAID